MFENANIAIFAGSGGEQFAERMCTYMNKKLGKSKVITFSEGNTFVRADESVRDREVILVQPIGMKANNEFVESLFWVDAFKRANAHSVTVVMPYFGYGKGDKKDEPRVSIRARVCADCLETVGADRFITMDLHAPQLQGFFTRPMDHLYAWPMLSEVIKRVGTENMVVVSPDAGYAKTAHKYADALGLPIAIGDKTRVDHTENAKVLQVIGEVKDKNCLIVDDFTISGGTLVNLAESLRARGAKEITAMLSHNIISEEGVKKINDSPISVVYSTDTVQNPHIEGQSKFKTVSVAPMFAETIMRYYNYESINDMFAVLPDKVVKAGIDYAQLKL